MLRPLWWHHRFDASWSEVRAQAMAGWERSPASQVLDPPVAEEAVAFGHGARHAFHWMAVWDRAVEERLRADWKATGAGAGLAWSDVSAAVRYGWESATAAATSSAALRGVKERG